MSFLFKGSFKFSSGTKIAKQNGMRLDDAMHFGFSTIIFSIFFHYFLEFYISVMFNVSVKNLYGIIKKKLIYIFFKDKGN